MSNSDRAPLCVDRQLCSSVWPGDRQFFKRMHIKNPGAEVHCPAGFGVPEMRRGDPCVRQYSRAELVGTRREVPLLQDADFEDVSVRGAAHRPTFFRMLLRFRAHDRHPEMVCILRSDR